MMELLVAVIGGISGLFLFQTLTKYQADKKQKELESQVIEIKKSEQQIVNNIKENEKTTQEKINEIDAKKDIDLIGNALADFFNNHKGKH